MQLGALIPFGDTGGDPSLVRDYALSLEALGYDFLEAPDHVLGSNPGAPSSGDPPARIADGMYHDPFVLLSFLAAATTKLAFSTGVLIVAQRQTALVAKIGTSTSNVSRSVIVPSKSTKTAHRDNRR